VKEYTGEDANTDMQHLSQRLESMEGGASDEDLTLELEKLIKTTAPEVEKKHIKEFPEVCMFLFLEFG